MTNVMMRGLLAAGLASGLAAVVTPAAALTAKECSTKYQAAKAANSLNGMKWNDFRKSQCSDAAAAPGAAPTAAATPAAPPAPAPAANPFQPGAPRTAPAPTTTAARPAPPPAPAPMAPGAPAAAGSAVYPSAVAAKYASEPAGKGRMHTCLDQYNTNKAGGGTGNGGMNWIAKGGGYYSECNKRLKS